MWRLTASFVIGASSLWMAACSKGDDLFPANGTLRLSVQDGGLVGQAASPTGATPGIQVAHWTFEDITATIHGGGADQSVPFLGIAPCSYTDNVLLLDDLSRQCGGSGIVLPADSPRTVTIRVEVSAMEVRRAERPDLPPSGDYDGDGVPNGVDNCALIPNPGQENPNASNSGPDSDAYGDACSILDPFTNRLTIPDLDGDGVEDRFDNCLWIPNPRPTSGSFQTDSNGDAIGDACERTANVFLPQSGRLALDCDLSFTPASASVGLVLVDFDDTIALTCDPGFTGCALDGGKITARLNGTAPPVPPNCVPVP